MSIDVLRDAVRSQPSLGTLFMEYHKLIAVLDYCRPG